MFSCVAAGVRRRMPFVTAVHLDLLSPCGVRGIHSVRFVQRLRCANEGKKA